MGLKDGLAFNPGLIDEFTHIYLYKKKVTADYIQKLQNKKAGLQEKEGEVIRLQIMPIEELHKVTSDAKVYSALFLYQQWSKKQNRK